MSTSGGSSGGASRAPLVTSITSSATPTLNFDTTDILEITALATAITSWTIAGSPSDGQQITVTITDAGSSEAIAWGAKFLANNPALPTATTPGSTLVAGFRYRASDTNLLFLGSSLA